MAYGMVKVGALALALAGTGVLGALGCSNDSGGAGAANAKLPEGVRSGVIEHEPCEEAGNKVELLDVNNDGRADIKKVFKNGRETCRITDLNHDGKPDMFEYYDQAGQLRRRESDYDDNSVVNSIEYYESGKLVRRELDTTNQGRIDTWDYFDPTTGARTKRERDANGDGKIDQWWTYENGQVTIARDHNGDGRPSPDSVITLGANGQVVSDAGVAAAEAGPPPPAPAITSPPALAMPSVNKDPAPTVSTADAGAAKPNRGGAKR